MARQTVDVVVTIRAKAFAGWGREVLQCVVSPDGTVRVWDDVAGYFTSCHSMSRTDQERARKLAKRALPN